MILDESGLHWHRVLHQSDDATGGECITYRCVEHRRLLWLRQRPNRDADWTDSYAVEYVANYYHSAAEALAAAEANPP